MKNLKIYIYGLFLSAISIIGIHQYQEVSYAQSVSTIDIVGYLNTQEPIKSWTAAKKQAMLDRFCRARGYTEQYDEDNNLIQTKKEFMNEDILNYIKIMFNADAEREAKEALTIEEITFQ